MTFSEISVLVPTRHRPDRLRKMIQSFEQTQDGQARLIFRADRDDPATVGITREHRTIVGDKLNGYASLPDFFNELYKASDGDVLMVANDDVVFKTQGWDTLILDAANEYPDGVFDFGVMTHNYLNFPLATISRRMADAVGFLFDPRFFWGDIFWRDVTSTLGRAIPLHDVEIDHEWVGFDPDRVFMAGEKVRRADHSKYHAQAVAEAVEKVKELLV